MFSGFDAVAIGAADQECEVLRALIEVALQELRETFAGEGFSALIEHQGEGLGSQCASEKLCFFCLALARRLALGLGEVINCQLCYAGFAAQAFKVGLVVEAEGFSGPAFNFPMPRTWSRMAYSAWGSCGECSDQSFSRL